MENLVQLLSAAVGLFVGVYGIVFWIVKGTSRKQKFIQRARKQGNVTTGYFKGHKFRGGSTSERLNPTLGDDQYTVTYTYRVNNKDYEKVLIFTSASIDFKIPKEIRVYYDSENPEKAVCPEEASQNAQRRHGCFMTILATFVAINIAFRFFEWILK